MTSIHRLSVVVPVYSGEDHLLDLVSELDVVRKQWEAEEAPIRLGEVIFVDDASIDGSASVLAKIETEHPWIRVITLSRNFGQHPATVAGILHADGDWIATLDEDLQHRPEYLARLLRRAVVDGQDVVYGLPEGRVHGSWRRDAMSRLYKTTLARLAGNPVIAKFNSFRMCRGNVARAAASVCGHETYLDVALTWFTNRFSFEEVPMVDSRYQSSGASGYSFKRLLSHARRLLVSSQAKVMRGAALLGVLAVGIAVIFAGRAFIMRSVREVLPGWSSLFVSILFFGGLSALLLSVVLEYLMNVVLHTQGKPTFFVVDRSSDKELATYFMSTDALVDHTD